MDASHRLMLRERRWPARGEATSAPAACHAASMIARCTSGSSAARRRTRWTSDHAVFCRSPSARPRRADERWGTSASSWTAANQVISGRCVPSITVPCATWNRQPHAAQRQRCGRPRHKCAALTRSQSGQTGPSGQRKRSRVAQQAFSSSGEVRHTGGGAARGIATEFQSGTPVPGSRASPPPRGAGAAQAAGRRAWAAARRGQRWTTRTSCRSS